MCVRFHKPSECTSCEYSACVHACMCSASSVCVCVCHTTCACRACIMHTRAKWVCTVCPRLKSCKENMSLCKPDKTRNRLTYRGCQFFLPVCHQHVGCQKGILTRLLLVQLRKECRLITAVRVRIRSSGVKIVFDMGEVQTEWASFYPMRRAWLYSMDYQPRQKRF